MNSISLEKVEIKKIEKKKKMLIMIINNNNNNNIYTSNNMKKRFSYYPAFCIFKLIVKN